MALVINTLNVVSPFTWANCTGQIPVSQDTAVGSVQSFDLLTIPPGLGGNVLMVYQSDSFNNIGFTRFFVRYPDLTTEEATFNFVAGVVTAQPYELVSSRLREGGTLYADYHRSTGGVFAVGNEAVVAAIVSVPGQSFTGIDPAGEPLAPSTDNLGNLTAPSGTTFAARFPADHGLLLFDPYRRIAVSRYIFVYSNFGALTSTPTYQVGNLGTWTDIIVATVDDIIQLAFGLYVAAQPGDLRTYTISNLTPLVSNPSAAALAVESTVFFPLSSGSSHGQIIG